MFVLSLKYASVLMDSLFQNIEFCKFYIIIKEMMIISDNNILLC
jgi:hypothetical protein